MPICRAYILKFCLFLMISIYISGCVSKEINITSDIQQNQPWVGPNESAVGRVLVDVTFMNTIRWLEWELPDSSDRIDSRRLTENLKEWLRDHDRWEPLLKRNPNTGDIYGVNTAMVIVALKPTVVITGPGSTPYYPYPMARYAGQPFGPPPYLNPDNPEPLYVELMYGFRYGTSVPWSEQPAWFSPELGVEWQPVSFSQDGEGIIALPWGNLILRRQNQMWQVSAVEKGGGNRAGNSQP